MWIVHFEQVSPIERSIIPIGAWELRQRLDIPYRVAINESVELAKTFGGTDGQMGQWGVRQAGATAARRRGCSGTDARPALNSAATSNLRRSR